jgi:iron complex outermembrane receptor protein
MRRNHFWLSSSILAAAVLIAPPVAAQDADAPEDIVITGSRVKRANETSATPVNTVTSEQLEQRGVVNIVDILSTIPQVGGNALSPSGAPINTLTAGLFTVDLRALGSSRTLVLVDGRRHVSGQPGTSAVDLNSIPTDLIERVEVTTGGASAVYGSDAVAGVVNILLKKSFQGLQLKAQGGISSRGDNGQQKLSAVAGTDFAGGRGNITGFVSYDNSEPVYGRDRAISSQAVLVSNTSRPDLTIFGPDAYPALYSARGVFGLNGTTVAGSSVQRTVLPDGTVTTPLASRDSYNPNLATIIVTPSERILAGGKARFEVSAAVTLTLDATYAHTRQLQEIGQTPVRLGPGEIAKIATSIPTSNPFIPAGFRALIPAGRTEFSVSRTFPELGPWTTEFTRDLARIVVGGNGKFDLFGNSWSWDAYYEYGRSKLRIDQSNRPNILKLNQGLRVEPAAGGGFQCADAAARAAGCVPINLFTGTSLTAPELNWLRATGTMRSKNVQQVAAASLTGDLFRLPAGAVTIAAGAEWRRESAAFVPDEIITSGQAFLTQSVTRGSFTVKEAFVEAVVPLLRDLPLIHALDLEAAFRAADYSTSGQANSWKIGGSYSPFGDLRFRALYSKAVRAPNVNELYSGNIVGNISVIDPCRGIATNPGRQAYCLSQPGITTAFNPPAQYIVTQITGGNQNLLPERARTLTIGGVYTPRFIRGLALSVDYFKIRIEDAITSITPQLAANQCADTNQAVYCSLLVRDPVSGLILQESATPINAASTRLSGIDAELSYRTPLAGGTFSSAINYTRTIDFETTPLPGAAKVTLLGQPYYPKNKANLRLAYQLGAVQASFNQRYYGRVSRVVGGTFEGNAVSPRWYSDVQLKVSPTERISLYAGVNNLLDTDPPLIPTPYVGTSSFTNTAGAVYDLVGRSFYAGATLKF